MLLNMEARYSVYADYDSSPEYPALTKLLADAGYFEQAEQVAKEGKLYFQHLKYKSNYSEINRARLEYYTLRMKARYREAEPFIRKAIEEASAIRPYRYDMVKSERLQLINNMIAQNRFVEAEIEARLVIEGSIKIFGPKSFHSFHAMAYLARVLLSQGRIDDAEKIIQVAISGYIELDLPSASQHVCHAKYILGRVFIAKGDYSRAMEQYDFFGGMKDTNRYHYDTYYSRNLDVIFTLIMTGRISEAMELIESTHKNSEYFLGKGIPLSAGLLALRGMANNELNNLESAYRDFMDSIPALSKSRSYDENRFLNHRYKIILESYLNLLQKLRGTALESRLSISAPSRAFEISSLLSESEVQSSVLASSLRMTIKDPALQELARTEQDIRNRITACRSLLQENLSKPFGDANRQGIINLKELLDNLTGAHKIIVAEIERQLPEYGSLLQARQPTITDVQSKLKSDEVMVSICTAESSTYVFVVSSNAPVEMVSVPIIKRDLEKLVSDLKQSLLPISDRLGELPPYDFEKAHELYSLLLKPVESVWKSSKNMILTISGPLGQLPLAVITTAPHQLEEDKGTLFSTYRDAPWLIKKISMSTVPSASSFVSLRSGPDSVGARMAFVGFGDPYFSKAQMSQAGSESKMRYVNNTAEEAQLAIRGIRLTQAGNLDDKKIASCSIESLERLPDTADELLSIAEALGANPVRDVYLGKRASEKLVKNMDISDRRVVAFASHALVPYDLDGLDQPAIALSAPSVTGDEDDGLLTMAEILDLKLNADWVVLSACNTGAAQGAGAEAISGLGRAFFYAGTRAILVSMWPVETTSAKELTTGIFRHQKENPGITNAQAHQMAMLQLIDGHGMLDVDGRIIASYAHPFFWAPFIIVGDNGMANLN